MSRQGSAEFRSLEDVLAHQLEDLYEAEVRILDGLPKMAEAASSRPLKDLLQKDLEEARRQLQRLEGVFTMMGLRHGGVTCEAMKGLIKDCEVAAGAKGDADARDALLIASVQRIKHYEIAGYGSARTFASRLGLHDIARQLQFTLQEEAAADRKLTEVAEAEVNAAAVH
jgi:ferritin-like metal-binding protein YciE